MSEPRPWSGGDAAFTLFMGLFWGFVIGACVEGRFASHHPPESRRLPDPIECRRLLRLSHTSADTLDVVLSARECLVEAEQ